MINIALRRATGILFRHHNVKIHLTWFDNNSSHMAIADAMKAYGGVSSIWQTSFYGTKILSVKQIQILCFYFHSWTRK